MEGMPRFPMFCPDPKVPANQYDKEFVLKVKEYILIHFQADPSSMDEALQEILHMKQQIAHGMMNVEGACLMKRYYSQLLLMKNRFPMEENDPVRTVFSWYDRAMDVPSTAAYEDVGFELACVMYNIGTVHANIAAEEARGDDNSIKNAFMHFQYAAWPLQYVRDELNSKPKYPKYNTIDFDKELLTFYVNVLLGQAQECLVEKSILDHRSNVVVARLAAHLRDLYKECLKHLEASSLGVIVASRKYKRWCRTCAIKSESYGAIAMLYMGMQADEDKKMGTRLGYFSIAKLEHMKVAIKLAEKDERPDMLASVNFLNDVVTAKYDNAKKENDFIYHDKIPSNEELVKSVEGLCKVRPHSFDPLDPSVGGEDLFSALLPPTVLKAVSEYEEVKNQMKREILKNVDEKNNEIQVFLSQMHLDDLQLDSTSTTDVRLPDMLLERNASLCTQPDAIPELLENLHKVTELAREAETKLTSLTSRLSAVDLPELTVDEGYKAINKELARLSEHHHQARTNNSELNKALVAHTTNLHLVGLPLGELTSRLAAPSVTPGSTKEGQTLKMLLDKIAEMQKQREMLVNRLAEEMDRDNITKKLLSNRDTNNQELFKTELQKHNETANYLRMNMDAQEKIMSALVDANADFSDYRKQINEAADSRTEQIMKLVTSFDVFTDICSKVEDGTRFYTKLLERAAKLTMAVEGIEAAFTAEKEKRDAEKRALEEKMEALRRAKEAREAMADFGVGDTVGPAGPGQQPQMTSSMNTPISSRGGPRSRVDYMEFYKNKMAGSQGGRPTPAQNPGMPPGAQGPAGFPPGPGMPSGYNILDQRYQLPPQGHQQQYQPHQPHQQYPSAQHSPLPPLAPPSPAPSSIADIQYSPRHEASSTPQPYQGQNVGYGAQPQLYQPQLPPQQPQQQYSATSVHQNPQATLPTSYRGYQNQDFTTTSSAVETPIMTMTPPQQQHMPVEVRQVQPAVQNVLPPQQYQAPQTGYQYQGQQPIHQHQQQQQQQQQYISPQKPQEQQQMGLNNQASSQPPQYQQQYTPQSQPQQYQAQSNTQAPQNYQGPPLVPTPQQQPVPQYQKPPVPTVQYTPSPPQQQQQVTPVPQQQQNQYQPPVMPQGAPQGVQQFTQYQNTNQHLGGQPQFQLQPQHPQQGFQGVQQQNQQQAQQPAPIVFDVGYFDRPKEQQPTPVVQTVKPQSPAPATFGVPTAQPIGAAPAPSPWHRAPTGASPWHAGVSATPQGPQTTGLGGTAQAQSGAHPMQQIPQAPHPQQQQQQPQHQQQQQFRPAPPPVQQMFAPQQPGQAQSNSDLLSSLLGDLHLPPALQPQSAPTVQNQNLQRAAPKSTNTSPVASDTSTATASENSSVKSSLSVLKAAASNSSIGDSSSISINNGHVMTTQGSRPAAAVMPIPQQSSTVALEEQPMLSMMLASSVSFTPQQNQNHPNGTVSSMSKTTNGQAVLPITDVTDPNKFKLGLGDRNRLEKRQLHASIKGLGPKPELNPVDPLNGLDPFWKAH